MVLPVKENNSKGLCNDLKAKFEMSEATSMQLSQFATGGGQFLYSREEDEKLNRTIQKIELIKGLAYPYFFSSFGQLERTLSYMPTKAII